MKTKAEAFAPYLCVSDIQVLLSRQDQHCSWNKAKQTYLFADRIDDDELGRYRIEPHKVRLESVLKVTGISIDILMKQIEIELLMKKSGLPSKDTA